MIWFKIKDLEQKISTDNLTDEDGVKYFVGWLAYGYIMQTLRAMGHSDTVNTYPFLLAIILPFFMIPYFFKQNKLFDNKDFFKRFIAISFVVSIRIIVIVFSSIFISLFIWDLKEPSPGFKTFHLTLSFVTIFLYYIMVFNSFRRLKNTLNK